MYVFAISPAGGYGDDVADAEGGVGVVDEDVGAAVEMLLNVPIPFLYANSCFYCLLHKTCGYHDGIYLPRGRCHDFRCRHVVLSSKGSGRLVALYCWGELRI